MQLHQLLRTIASGVPIILFDVSGIEICEVYTKEDLNTDLYEYNVLEISLGRIRTFIDTKSALYIMIEK